VLPQQLQTAQTVKIQFSDQSQASAVVAVLVAELTHLAVAVAQAVVAFMLVASVALEHPVRAMLVAHQVQQTLLAVAAVALALLAVMDLAQMAAMVALAHRRQLPAHL
jgi:hypothetical protein